MISKLLKHFSKMIRRSEIFVKKAANRLLRLHNDVRIKNFGNLMHRKVFLFLHGTTFRLHIETTVTCLASSWRVLGAAGGTCSQ